jgi:hypothetical protein
MAITNFERVGKAMELLKSGLRPFVERELEAAYGKYWVTKVAEKWQHDLDWPDGTDEPHLDTAAILRMMWEQWNSVFNKTLGFAERSIVSELREFRNRWAHQEAFSGDDTYRALDSAARLLTAVSAPQATDLEKMKTELLRVRFDEQSRTERRKSNGAAVKSEVTGALKPWREIITPHRDVAGGRYEQAEFAADLWQVYEGRGVAEYLNPVEFFRRTYLTEGLKQLLVNGIRRINGVGGDPVVQLQTNFGGGKTHSMLALYHLFSGITPNELVGIDSLMRENDLKIVPKANIAVLVGNKISPGNPRVKADGTVINTLWGELAWQLGGKKAFESVRADDEKATSPGDTLRELFSEYGPCLILIDEWVAYARQLHDEKILPAGTFDTQFSFAQALTESAKAAGNCLLVISLPASDTAGSPHTQVDEVEVGGRRGREALSRLQNVVGRIESSWRPAGAEEGFEIVRRRLFEPMKEREQFVGRDNVIRAFTDLYRVQQQEFPTECRDADYEKRLIAAYPIHPEVFDRLYSDWSTLIKFQRTRGVLRLMAAVIHSLWDKGDRNPLIMPWNIPIDDPRVQPELTRYLSDNWVPVIEKDVDGPNSLPVQFDGEVANLGKYSATRRVARTIYLGSAPMAKAANRGLDDRRIKLGCVMPGETVAIFGDALRRLSSKATYLYVDGSRYWYDTQPTVTKLAEDRAEQCKRNQDRVEEEINRHIRESLNDRGDFSRIHLLAQTGFDVPDDFDARLVVLGIDHPHGKELKSPALLKAKEIFESKGSAPRIYRNSIVFLAADKNRLVELYDGACQYLAWASILDEKEQLDLSPFHVRQAETKIASAKTTMTSRIPETYCWLIVPEQLKPEDEIKFETYQLRGSETLAQRASRKLRNDSLLATGLAASNLRMILDKIPLWSGNHVSVKQLMEYFARYIYLPRLVNSSLLLKAVNEGLEMPSWKTDSFAYAESYDDAAGRYIGLRYGTACNVIHDSDTHGLLVKPDEAQRQIEAEKLTTEGSEVVSPEGNQPDEHDGGGVTTVTVTEGEKPEEQVATVAKYKRYYGVVDIDATRAGSEAAQIAEEVIAHLNGLLNTRVKVTLEIEADISDGAPEHVIRTVTENSRTLKFRSSEFEKE